MTLKAFEPKKFKIGKSDMNILAQTSSSTNNDNQARRHLTGQKFTPAAEKLLVAFGI